MGRGRWQGTSQTNEDDLAEEIQTEEVRCRDKWTQHPIQFDVKVTTNAEGEVISGPTYYVSHAPSQPRHTARNRRCGPAVSKLSNKYTITLHV